MSDPPAKKDRGLVSLADVPEELGTWVASLVTEALRADLVYTNLEVREALVDAANKPEAVRAKPADRWKKAQGIVERDLRAAKKARPKAPAQAPEEPGPTVEPCADQDAALSIIDKILRTKTKAGSTIVLLTCAQDHVIELLESVVYIGFKGKTGSGKGTGLECAMLLTRKGEVLSVTTAADLASAIDEGRAIGIPEADTLIQTNPLIAKLYRDGYRRGPKYGFKELAPDGTTWERAERELFGFKAFDYHTSFDVHILGRAAVVETITDTSVDRAMDAEKKARHLAPVRAYLVREAERARRERGWTKEKVDQLWDSPEFREEVRALGGAVGRDHIVGANLLLVARIYGWDLTKLIRQAVARRHIVDELSVQAEVGDAITALSNVDINTGMMVNPDLELRTSDVLTAINDQRGKQRLKSLPIGDFYSILADLGFEREVDWYRSKAGGPNRDRAVILPRRFVQGGSCQAAQPAHPAQTHQEALPPADGESAPGTHGPLVGPAGGYGPAHDQDGPAGGGSAGPCDGPSVPTSEKPQNGPDGPRGPALEGGGPEKGPVMEEPDPPIPLERAPLEPGPGDLPPEAIANVRLLLKRAAPEPVVWVDARSELARTTGISEAQYDGAVGGLLGSGEIVQVSEGVFRLREGS
jgi:hypothetical protein